MPRPTTAPYELGKITVRPHPTTPGLLQARGYKVRAMVRDRSKAGDFGTTVEVVEADVTKPDTLAAAVKGATFVVSAIGATAATPPNNPENVVLVFPAMIRRVEPSVGPILTAPPPEGPSASEPISADTPSPTTNVATGWILKAGLKAELFTMPPSMVKPPPMAATVNE